MSIHSPASMPSLTFFGDASSKDQPHMVAGGFDYLIKVRTSDMEHYRRFLGEKLSSIKDISSTHTYVVMEEIKASSAIKVSDS